MGRQLRIQYPGAIYHLMSRSDRREEIFRDDLDREDFLKTLGSACQRTGLQRGEDGVWSSLSTFPHQYSHFELELTFLVLFRVR
jgi:hypothetical protein